MERLEIEILAGISGLEKSLNAAQSKLEKFGKAAEQLGATFSKALTLPIVGLGVASVKAFGDIQALKNGLTAVTGSADEAATQFVRLQKIAKLPGLGLQEAVKGSINLQTIGFSAEKAESSMAAFGNAVATVGKGRVEFERAIYGLQQLANTDFPLGEDLNIIKDAIPQVTPLLKEAFGTARSDDLKTLGITSQQVVDTIISGLNKLPPVTGGINGAFENLGDGVKTNLAEIGESINTAFDISGIIDAFIGKLSSLVQAFRSLSPATQKVIITIAGILAALGPVILGVGVFTTSVIPALTAGLTVLGGAFAAITGPIALIAVAIAGAVYLIIKNWDSIVAYFTTGVGKGVFDVLIDTFNSAVDYIKALWSGLTKFLTAFWKEWGGTITMITKTAFGQIIEVIKIAFTILGTVFKLATAVLTGNWSDIGPILINATKRIWNGIISIITNAIQFTTGLLAKFLDFIGLDGVGKKVADITNIIKDKLSFDIPVKVDDKETEKQVAASTEKITKTVVKTTVAAVSEAAKKTKEIYEELNKDLTKNSLQFGTDSLREDNVKSYQKAIDSLIDNGYTPASKAIQDLINKQTSLNLLQDAKGLGFKTTNAKPNVVDVKLNIPAVDLSNFDVVKAITVKLNKDFFDLSQTILQSGVSDAFAAIGNSMGEALANGSNIIQGLGVALLGVIGNIATQLGKAAIGIGVAMIGIKNAFSNPFTAIAAGIALIALGSFISSKVANIPKGENISANSSQSTPIRQFANGGIISGPTMGLMGEYAGARSNPEVVAPLNKLKGMLPQGDSGVIIPDVKLRGEDLYVSFKRASSRFGGLNG